MIFFFFRKVGTCILSTVRNAARLAVNVASMRTTKSQYAATRVLLDSAFGASPPPWGVNDVKANQKLSFRVKSLQAGNCFNFLAELY